MPPPLCNNRPSTDRLRNPLQLTNPSNSTSTRPPQSLPAPQPKSASVANVPALPTHKAPICTQMPISQAIQTSATQPSSTAIVRHGTAATIAPTRRTNENKAPVLLRARAMLRSIYRIALISTGARNRKRAMIRWRIRLRSFFLGRGRGGSG